MTPEINRIYLGDHSGKKLPKVLPLWPENWVDAVVTDPPYELTSARPGGRSPATQGKVMKGFMGMEWDGSGIAYSVEFWRDVLRVMKPGAYLLAFGGTRTYHRMVCAIEDAGFEIRDQIQWIYGSGFPKSVNVAIAVAKKINPNWEIGDEIPDEAKAFMGEGTALKPANEPIVVARKPLSEGTVAANVLRWGTGALNIDESRIAYLSEADKDSATPQGACTAKSGALAGGTENEAERTEFSRPEQKGRWPANVILDEEAARILDEQSGVIFSGSRAAGVRVGMGFGGASGDGGPAIIGNEGGASRFFYCAKPSTAERNEGLQEGPPDARPRDEGRQAGLPGGDNPRNRGAQAVANFHPTVKPVALMAYLIKLVTPRGGVVLDPFLGSGTTAITAETLMTKWIACEMGAEYISLAEKRIAAETKQGKLL